ERAMPRRTDLDQLQRPESARERSLYIVGDRLVSPHQYGILFECGAHLGKNRRVGCCLDQTHTVNFSAEVRMQTLDTHDDPPADWGQKHTAIRFEKLAGTLSSSPGKQAGKPHSGCIYIYVKIRAPCSGGPRVPVAQAVAADS